MQRFFIRCKQRYSLKARKTNITMCAHTTENIFHRQIIVCSNAILHNLKSLLRCYPTVVPHQGVPNYLIGICQGVGAVFGVLGTLLYPFLRKKFGTVRTGLFGISSQLAILMLCVAAVFVPSHSVENSASGYYSPVCTVNTSLCPGASCNTSLCPGASCNTSICPGASCNTSLCPGASCNTSLCPGASCNNTNGVASASIQPTPSLSLASTSSQLRPTPTRLTTHTSSQLRPTPTRLTAHTASQFLPTPSPSPPSQVNVAVILLLMGVVGCRVGLWMFDLAVQQLVQETVPEDERGVVGGVMNAMNSIMDMLHYVMVIAAPRPEHFRWLTLISVAMVMLGLVLYGAYIRKARGHFFHFNDCYRYVKKCAEKRTITTERMERVIEDDSMQLLSETDDDNELL